MICRGICVKYCTTIYGERYICNTRGVTATVNCNGSCGDPELYNQCNADEELSSTGTIGGSSCPPACSSYVWSYGCNNNKCTGNIVCADNGYTSWGNCLASCPADTSTTPPYVAPGDPPCDWIVGNRNDCECRMKYSNEAVDNGQNCGGSNQQAPRGCSYQGDANHGCCCHQSPPPPPPRYRCTANSCAYGNQNGNYVGNPTCSGNCGVKCTISRDDGTQVNSGSMNQNTGLCDGTGGNVNMVRSVTNKVSNPAKFKLTCSSEEFISGNNVNRHWSITNIKYDNTDIYNNPGTGIVTTQPAEIINFNPAATVVPTSGLISVKSMFMNFRVSYPIETTGISASGITCDNKVNLEKLGDSVGGEFYDQYSYTCSKLNNPVDTQATQQNLLRDEIAKRLNGPLSGGVPIAPKWGTFTRVGNGPITTSTATTSINNDTITTTPDSLCAGIPCITDKFTDILYFKVKHKSTYTPPTGVNCTDLYPLTTEVTGTYYQLICATGDTAITQANLADYARQMLNGSGYKPNTSLGMGIPVFDGVSQYNYTDPVSSSTSTPNVTPRLQNVYAKTEDPNLQKNTFTAYFEVKFKDGITYGSKNIDVTVTDGYTGNPSSATVRVSQTIDTSLPKVTRTMEVQSMNKFNVKSVATDDHSLKTHAYYIAPTKYQTAGTSVTPDNYPFLAQHRDMSYLEANQIKSISAVTPANDFASVSNLTNEGSNSAYFISRSLAANTLTDTREAQYELDLTKLSNQTQAYDLTFGNGKDSVNGSISNNGFGRWYAEDSFCNASSPAPQDISVGSPWLQSRVGSTYIKGPSLTNTTYAANESIHQITSGCVPLSSSLSQQNAPSYCPETADTYLSTYMYQSGVTANMAGPISDAGSGSTDRQSRKNITSSSYQHGMTKVSNYFKGATGAYEYVKNIVQKAIDDNDQTNPINVPCATNGRSRVIKRVGNTTINQASNDTGPINMLNNIVDGTTNDYPCDDKAGTNVVSIDGNLTINSFTQPGTTSLPSQGNGNFNGYIIPTAGCSSSVAEMQFHPNPQTTPATPLSKDLTVAPGVTFKAVASKNIAVSPYVTTATNAIIYMQSPDGSITTVGSNGTWDMASFSTPGTVYTFMAVVNNTSGGCRTNTGYLRISGTFAGTIPGTLPATYSPAPGPTAPAGINVQAGNNPAWPHWYVGTSTIILVSGNVTINPDIRKDLDNSAGSLIIISGGNIEILGGTYKSYKQTNKTDYPFYDQIDAFLVADGQIRVDEDTPSGAVVLDGLRIYGGLVQLGINNSTFVPCKLPNQPATQRTGVDDDPCFNRDLILMHNLIAPAEKVVYDPQVEEIFSSAIGELNTVYSIREVKTKTIGNLP